jgi:pectate lyase
MGSLFRGAAAAARPSRHHRAGVMLLALLLTVVLAACDLPGGIGGDAPEPDLPAEPEAPGDEVPGDEGDVSEESDPVSEESEPEAEEPGEETPEPAPAPAPADDGPVGFASVEGGTTGGAGGETVSVSTADEFAAAVGADGPAVVQVNGTIETSGMTSIASDKTIEGGTISGGGLTMRGVSNIIIRNMTFTGADDDSINIEEGSTNIWIDHNDFSNGFDGLVDIKRGSDFITVSWNHFHDHDKTALLGHSDDNASQDEGHLRVTYHHNWFEGTNQRQPRARFGDPVHVFNNYYDNVGSYGVASTNEAGVLVEGNYFEGVSSPTVIQTGSSPEGNIVERDNVYDGSGEPETRGTAEEPSNHYSYTLDDPASIPAIVSAGAGPQ